MSNEEKISKVQISCLSMIYLTPLTNPYKIKGNQEFDLTYFDKKIVKINKKQ